MGIDNIDYSEILTYKGRSFLFCQVTGVKNCPRDQCFQKIMSHDPEKNVIDPGGRGCLGKSKYMICVYFNYQPFLALLELTNI
jgi:hypothetical protein